MVVTARGTIYSREFPTLSNRGISRDVMQGHLRRLNGIASCPMLSTEKAWTDSYRTVISVSIDTPEQALVSVLYS